MESTENTITFENTILRIPISQIRTNPNNPRRVMKPQAVYACAGSMMTNGQETPIKLRKLGVRNEELEVKSAQTTDNPSNYQYELLGGHIRLEAAKILKWDSLNAIILDADDDQAEMAAMLDNNVEDMFWLDRYQFIEQRLQKDPQLTQEELAHQLGMDASVLSRGVKIMKALNETSRALLRENFAFSQGSYEISENSILRLSDLNKDKPEDLDLIERSLRVALSSQMTEPHVARLVRWVQSGKKPGDFPTQVVNHNSNQDLHQNIDPTDPYSSYWQGLPKNAKVIRNKKGYVLRLQLAPSEAPTAVYSALAGVEHLKETALLPDSPPADPRFSQALPDIVSEGRKKLALEQGMKRAHEEAQKKAKEAKKTQKGQVEKAQKEAQKIKDLENLKAETKTKLETIFGTGLLADSLWQKVQAGQKGEALKVAKTVLLASDKTKEEQETLIKELKVMFNKVSSRRNSEKAETHDGTPKTEQTGEKELSTTGVASSLTPAYSAGIPRNDSGNYDMVQGASLNDSKNIDVVQGAFHTNGAAETLETTPSPTPETPSNPQKGLFDQVKDAVIKQVGVADGESLAGMATDMLVKDAKSAVNYEIRKGMRNLIKDAL